MRQHGKDRSVAFYSYSLTGLAPGKTYYAKLKPARVSPNADRGVSPGCRNGRGRP